MNHNLCFIQTPTMSQMAILFNVNDILCPLQMENGCVLNSTYPGGCALPNRNGSMPPTIQVPSPETLPTLPDPPATGFYLWPSDQGQSCSRTLWMARNIQWLDQPYTSTHHNKQSWRNVGRHLCCLFLSFHFDFVMLCQGRGSPSYILSHIIIWVLCLH